MFYVKHSKPFLYIFIYLMSFVYLIFLFIINAAHIINESY